METKPWIGKFIAYYAQVWPNIKIDLETATRVFSDQFSKHNITAREAMAGIDEMVMMGMEFPPALPVLIKTILDARATLAGKAKEPGEAVWDRLLSYASQGASWGWVSEQLDEHQKRSIRSAGGYERVRYADITTELPFVRKAFLEAYSSLSEAAENQDRTKLVWDQVQATLAAQNTDSRNKIISNLNTTSNKPKEAV